MATDYNISWWAYDLSSYLQKQKYPINLTDLAKRQRVGTEEEQPPASAGE